MTKQQIKEELLQCTKGRPFISLTEIRKAMHVGKDGASSMVRGLYYIRNGNRKDYLVEDLAERLAKIKQC
jgi:hypothetical protein